MSFSARTRRLQASGLAPTDGKEKSKSAVVRHGKPSSGHLPRSPAAPGSGRKR